MKAMTRGEAIACMSRIKSSLENIQKRRDELKAAILELTEGSGWLALGYTSWRECIEKELTINQRTAYRLLAAAVVEHQVGENNSIPERTARPLRSAPLDLRRDIWEKAKAAAGAKMPSADTVAETATEVLQEVEAEEHVLHVRRLNEDYRQLMLRCLHWAEKIDRQLAGCIPLPPFPLRQTAHRLAADLQAESKKQT